MDWEEILLTLLLDLAITVFFYLLVPVIFCLRKKSLAQKQIKTIVIINGIVVWLMFQILTLELTGESSSGVAVLLWSFVAYKLLRRYCLAKDMREKASPAEPYVFDKNKTVEDSKSTEPEKIIEISLSPKGETPKKYGNYNIYGADVRFNPENSPSVQEKKYSGNKTTSTEEEIKAEAPTPKSTRYCSLCGGAIDDNTKQCTKCGKQYFKGFTKTGIALIVVSALLLISIIINIVQASDIAWYKDRIHQIRNEYGDAAAFYDEYAVCVSDINDYYHKYGCSRFDDSEFWIFNLEYAEYQGYEPCPYCCD